MAQGDGTALTAAARGAAAADRGDGAADDAQGARIVESSPDCLKVLDLEGRLLSMSPRLEIESVPGAGTRLTLVGPPPPQPASPTRVAPGLAPLGAGPAGRLGPGVRLRVIIADDHTILREGLASLLAMEPDIEVVGEAADGAEAVALARTLRPDVVVMDVSMPGTNGIDATRTIRRELEGVRVVALSMHEEAALSAAMSAAGASAYVTKGGSPNALVAAIRAAASASPARGAPRIEAARRDRLIPS